MIVNKFKPVRDENQKEQIIHCTACGQQAWKGCLNGPENGLHLTGFSGYYGGFTDYTLPIGDQEPVNKKDLEEAMTHDNAWFCHACCVKLFNAFPHLARAVGIRNDDPRQSLHHPCEDDRPCCRYAWNVKRSIYIEDDFVEYYAHFDPDQKAYVWKEL